jgi:hypothetical protein
MSASVFTLGELAQRADAELRGPADLQISGLAALQDAGPEQLTFLMIGTSITPSAIGNRGTDNSARSSFCTRMISSDKALRDRSASTRPSNSNSSAFV